jgi:hypothetical protein
MARLSLPAPQLCSCKPLHPPDRALPGVCGLRLHIALAPAYPAAAEQRDIFPLPLPAGRLAPCECP